MFLSLFVLILLFKFNITLFFLFFLSLIGGERNNFLLLFMFVLRDDDLFIGNDSTFKLNFICFFVLYGETKEILLKLLLIFLSLFKPFKLIFF